MVLYPEVHRKAQEEIDRVIGLERLPTFDDRHSLPYLDCVLKEVYRYVTSSDWPKKKRKKVSHRSKMEPSTSPV